MTKLRLFARHTSVCLGHPLPHTSVSGAASAAAAAIRHSLATGLAAYAFAAVMLSIAPNASAQGGDASAGELKAATCKGCHAIEKYTNVYPTYYVPRLGGQHEAYIVAALQAYKNGQRSHATMVAQASSLSEQDMKDIAAYFSSQMSK